MENGSDDKSKNTYVVISPNRSVDMSNSISNDKSRLTHVEKFKYKLNIISTAE